MFVLFASVPPAVVEDEADVPDSRIDFLKRNDQKKSMTWTERRSCRLVSFLLRVSKKWSASAVRLPSCKFRGKLAEKWLSSSACASDHARSTSRRLLLMTSSAIAEAHGTTVGISCRCSGIATSSRWLTVTGRICSMNRFTIGCRTSQRARLATVTGAWVSRRCKWRAGRSQCWLSRCSSHSRICSSRSLRRQRTTTREKEKNIQINQED